MLFQLLFKGTHHTHPQFKRRAEEKSSENPSGMIRKMFLDSWNAIVYCKFLCPAPIGFDHCRADPNSRSSPRMPFNHIIWPGCSAVPLSQGPSSHSGNALGFPDTALTSLPIHMPSVLLGAWKDGAVRGINGPTTSKRTSTLPGSRRP